MRFHINNLFLPSPWFYDLNYVLCLSCPWQPPLQSISSEVWNNHKSYAVTYLSVKRQQITLWLILENPINFWANPAHVISVLAHSLNSKHFRLLRRELRGNEIKSLPIRQLYFEIWDICVELLWIHNYSYLLGRQGLLQNGIKTFLFSTSEPCFGYF